MKEIDEETLEARRTGNQFKISQDFGEIENLGVNQFKDVPPEAMAALMRIGNSENFGNASEEELKETLRKELGNDHEALNKTLSALVNQGSSFQSQMIAQVIRARRRKGEDNWESAGKNYQERLEFVKQLHWKDAAELIGYCKAVLKDMKQIQKDTMGKYFGFSNAGKEEPLVYPLQS